MKKNVLIVDDDTDIAEAMGMVLSEAGFSTQIVSDPARLTYIISASQPSLVLLDVLMGSADGREICRELKDNVNTRDVPVVMISAHMGTQAKYQEYGADDFLSKPFAIDDLVAIVQKYA